MKILSKDQKELRALEARVIAAKISDLNTKIEMAKAMAKPEIMGPATGDNLQKLIRERDDL